MDRLHPLDSSFLHLEDDITHMHIGSCWILAGPPPPYEDVLALVESKLDRMPRYRQRVRFVPGAVGPPVWVDDPHFNLSYHLRHSALPPPGGRDELSALMGRLMSQPLDRARPLWELWMVESLEGGRWALITKVHHCMVDGVAGIDLATALLDADPEAPLPTIEPWQPDREPTDVELFASSLGAAFGDPGALLRTVRRGPRRLFRETVDTLTGLGSMGRRLTPTATSSIEGPIGPHRRWTWAETTLDDIGDIRRALGGTVNDVVLTAVAGGFRRLLVSRGEPVDGETVRTLVPVSLRPPDDHSGGNRVGSIIAELPVGIEDPVERLDAVRHQLDQLKADHQVDASQLLVGLAEMTPPMLWARSLEQTTAAQRFAPQQSVHTVTTNVPGPRVPLYAVGRELEAYLPYVPIGQGARIGVAILSYRRNMALGLTGDWETTADIDLLRVGIEAELAILHTRATEPGEGPAEAPATEEPASV
ncbi:MAG: wax ester/triacylglycerol synthase family O-acyltransferase [Actinomycetota bacterium]|nr:wax ester/triacylglycerol synthase family O-acyltransferase [Actinomycetota bacterium]